MEIILIGENHSDPIARKLVLKLIEKEKAYNRKIQFMIEMEPHDYDKMAENQRNHIKPKEGFEYIFAMLELASKVPLTITPIDIPISYLLSCAKQKIDQNQITSTNSILNSILLKEWDGFETVLKGYLPRFSKDLVDKTLYDCLHDLQKVEACVAMTDMMHGERREEFYKKRTMQTIRDQYFYKKIEEAISINEADILIILVGYNHYAYLETNINKNGIQKDFHSINYPSLEQSDDFILKIRDEQTESIASARLSPSM